MEQPELSVQFTPFQDADGSHGLSMSWIAPGIYFTCLLSMEAAEAMVTGFPEYLTKTINEIKEKISGSQGE